MKLGMIYPCDVRSFDNAKDLGLDFVEFDLNHPDYWGTSIIRDIMPMADSIAAKAKETGVFVGAVGRWGSQVIDNDGNVIEEEFAEVKAGIDFCEIVGCENFLVSVNYVNNLTYYKNITASINYLNMVVEYAKSKNVTVSIVNCMMGGNYIRTPAQWDLVLDEVPGLKIKYDPSHSFVHGGENGAYMKESLLYGNRFGYIHIKGVVQTGDSEEASTWDKHDLAKKHPELKDEIMQSGYGHDNYDNPPAGLDAINWRGFFGAIYKHDYDGLLSIEPHSASWHGEKGDKGVKYTINYIRSLMI